MPALPALRYYDGSDPCGPSPRAAGLPACLATPSWHSASNHVVCPGIALHATNQRTGRVSDFALREEARRHTPPNRVRHPADCQFASSCSPPRLTATQLPSATGSWLTLTQTFTVLMSRLHGRTPPPFGLLLDAATPKTPPPRSGYGLGKRCRTRAATPKQHPRQLLCLVRHASRANPVARSARRCVHRSGIKEEPVGRGTAAEANAPSG